MSINDAAEGGEEGIFMETMLKTIYQSQEIRVGESETIEVKAPFGFSSKQRRPKVSFHGRVEALKAEDSMSWRLQLKRSSACTNVSILNLTESNSFDFETSDDNLLSSSESEVCDVAPESQCLSNSGLMFAKDSVSDLKEKSSILSNDICSLQSESTALYENLEQRQKEVEELDRTCNHLEQKLSRINAKLVDIYEKRESLNNLKYDILKDISSIQGLLQNVDSRSDTSLFKDLNQNIIILCSSIKDLRHSLEGTGHRAEASQLAEKQEMTTLMPVIEELRDNVAQICVSFESASLLLKNVYRTVFNMNTRIESFISQGNCAQEQQELLIDNTQELRASMESFNPL